MIMFTIFYDFVLFLKKILLQTKITSKTISTVKTIQRKQSDLITSHFLLIKVLGRHSLKEQLPRPLNKWYIYPPLYFNQKLKKIERKLKKTLNNQQYKINKTYFVFMNFILVFTVGECTLLNMHIHQGERRKLFRTSSYSLLKVVW